jgi:hypothetical protein
MPCVVVLRPIEQVRHQLRLTGTGRKKMGLAHLVKCLFVLEPNITNCTRWMVRRYLVVTSYILFVDLYTITAVAGYWAMNRDHVLVYCQPNVGKSMRLKLTACIAGLSKKPILQRVHFGCTGVSR